MMDIMQYRGYSSECNSLPIFYKVDNLLLQSGFSPTLMGYKYLQQAIILCCENKDLLSYKTKVLYPMIAKKYKVPTHNIERDIRFAINKLWLQLKTPDYTFLRHSLIFSADTRPTCGEVINYFTMYIEK